MERLEEEGRNIIRALKPIERLVPENPPFVACGKYLLSKQTSRELPRNVKFEPLAERSASTKHHFVRKEYNKVENELQNTKVKAEEHRKRMIVEWERLKEIQQELRNSFIKFDEFMKQNEHKREQATKKKDELAVVLKEKTAELERLKKEFVQMKELRIMVDDRLKDYHIFEKFLVDVAKRDSVNFGNINGIFSRFNALVEARKDLTNRYENYMQELERVRNGINQLILEKSVQLNGLDNIITDLKKRFEKAKNKVKTTEKFNNEAYLEGHDKVSEINFSLDTCWELYESICKRRNMKPIHKNSPAQQLETIKKYLKKLSLINRMVAALQDENWIAPIDRDSSGGDSIVVNVVTKVSKK